MLVSLVLGFLLQLLVTEVPYFIQLFGTCHLTLSEWGHLLFLSSMPLLAHEVLILLSMLFRHRTDS
jgi:Ca2+-transporting ATPase